MNIVCAPQGLVDPERPGRRVGDIAAAGFEGVMLDAFMCCPPDEFELRGVHPESLYESMKPFLDRCGQEGLLMPIARAPHPKRNTKRSDLKEVLLQLVKESIRVCEKAGCGYLIVDPLFAGIGNRGTGCEGIGNRKSGCEGIGNRRTGCEGIGSGETRCEGIGSREAGCAGIESGKTRSGMEWEVNREYYLSLAKAAEESRVMILLQNQCREHNGHLMRGICADAEEAAAWVDALNEAAGRECFGFCMDTGVCSLCGQNIREYAAALGARMKAVVLRDCDGHYETSMLPFTCTNCGSSATDWLGVVRGLREIDFDGLLIMDLGTTAEAFSRLLHPQLLQLAYGVAEFFKWQVSMKRVLKKYDTRVLFGAGNMCRNFMKCYGDEFPPLFTCDNNRERWGERFEGLEIKAPESLKELSPDCAIFICNIYYREIEEQLREMGIRNPIEYFNDEYMPSYYFDRLEEWKGEV